MKSASADLIQGDPECSYKHFTAAVKSPIDPDAAIDVECFMSTDSPDADDEVMLPNGVDLSRFTKNPVVMLCHAMGQPGCYYPLPVGNALWTKQAKRGVLAGVRFTDKTEMGREVKALFADNMLRSFSVGFRPTETSAMTRKEAETRPDWFAAYERTKGHIRVHRKWHLVELSVAPVPCNPDALVTSYKAKGILVPSWLKPSLPRENPMSEPTESKAAKVEDEATDTDEEKSCECGKGDACECAKSDEKTCTCGKSECEKCSGMAEGSGAAGGATVKPKADEPDDEDDEDLESKAMGDDEPDDTEEAEEEEEDDDPDEIGPLKRYDHVSVKAPHYRGVGRIESMHTCGHVPHASNHMMGTKDDPAACVKAYRKMGDGHVPTDDHVAVKVAHITKLGSPLAAPSKKAAPAPAKKTVRTEPIVEPPPEIKVKSDQEVRAELIAKLNQMLSPDGFRRIAREEAERAAGFV